MKRYLVAGLAFAGLFHCLPAVAQNSGAVPQYAVPIGKGAGTTGFDSAAPGTTGWALVSNGPGAKPTFQSVAGAAFGVQNANKVFSGPASGADALPAFRALVGADLPLPGASSLGGVKSLSASSNNFLTGLGTDGVFTRAQPAFSNLSGSATCAQLPALTGNVTTSAGSCATTIASNAVSNSMLAGSIAASKLIGTDIATVGTVTAGTWQGTKIGLAYGGTNADLSATGGTSRFLKQASTGAAITVVQPSCSDLSGVAASCSTDATNAANISSGTLPAARLPNPAASTLGGVKSKDCVSGGQFVQTIGTDGSVTCATPASGGTGSSTSSFSAHKNGTDQTGLVAGGTNTLVTFGTEVWDTGSNFASSTWTPPAGKVKISVQVYITGTFAVGALQTVALFKNGVDYKDGFVYAAAANNAIAQLDVIADANGTDTFDVRVRGSVTSGTLTVSGDPKWTFFSGSMI